MRKWRTWISLIVIAVLSWIELQYVSESAPDLLKESTRKSLHTVFYLAVLLTGFWGWYKHPAKWIKNIWVLSYSFIIIAVLVMWLIGLRDSAHSLMDFFISPVPFLILLVFSNMKWPELK